VGKSTILKRVKFRKIIDYKVLSFSSEMAKLSGISPDNLNELPDNQHIFLVNKVYSSISSEKEDIILDDHYSILERNPTLIRFETGIPEEYIKYFTNFVLFEADFETILKRRIKDNETPIRRNKRITKQRCRGEHPYGTMTRSFKAGHTRLTTIPRVYVQQAFVCIAYNFHRLNFLVKINIARAITI